MSDTLGATLVAQFDRMVRGDGGELRLAEETPARITVTYRPGRPAPDCETGACVMPGAELRELLTETLRRRAPGVELELELVR